MYEDPQQQTQVKKSEGKIGKEKKKHVKPNSENSLKISYNRKKAKQTRWIKTKIEKKKRDEEGCQKEGGNARQPASSINRRQRGVSQVGAPERPEHAQAPQTSNVIDLPLFVPRSDRKRVEMAEALGAAADVRGRTAQKNELD